RPAAGTAGEFGSPVIVATKVRATIDVSRFVPMLDDRARFVLEPTFTFVDGSTGAVLYSRSFREEMLYRPNENVPPLSAFFDLMDRLLPDFLAIVGHQAFYGQRILLK